MDEMLATAPSIVAVFGKTVFKLRPAGPVNSMMTAVSSLDTKSRDKFDLKSKLAEMPWLIKSKMV